MLVLELVYTATILGIGRTENFLNWRTQNTSVVYWRWALNMEIMSSLCTVCVIFFFNRPTGTFSKSQLIPVVKLLPINAGMGSWLIFLVFFFSTQELAEVPSRLQENLHYLISCLLFFKKKKNVTRTDESGLLKFFIHNFELRSVTK